MLKISDLAAEPRHVVAIIGGAVSGSEAAALCASRGIVSIVIEQNTRPYGKIEDGLPRWHDKLRAKEYARIDENLSQEGVFFVPETLVGRDIAFEDVAGKWGLSALLLANGAWRDRPLAVPDVDNYIGRGLLYQNPFVYWFNHYHEADYDGPQYEVKEGAIVVGGGLASVDVVKIINLELYKRALSKRGIEVDIVEMEHKGIAATLKKHQLDPETLGVQGCTLYYRRRKKDMPLAFPRDDSPEQLAKTEGVREKMVGILKTKFLVEMEECSLPVGVLAEGNELKGLTFRRTEIRDRRVVELEGTDYDVRSDQVISSIGSVPERIAGIPTKGELYDYANWDTGAVSGLPGVFGLGNVLTGKGNIKDSRVNAKDIGDQVIADYLGLTDAHDPSAMDGAHDAARQAAQPAVDSAIRRAKLSEDKVQVIVDAVQERWRQIGYDGDYDSWMSTRRPAS